MTRELLFSDNILKKKILEELNEDVKKADNITLMLLSSDIYPVIIKCLKDEDNDIRELSSHLLVTLLIKNFIILVIIKYTNNF